MLIEVPIIPEARHAVLVLRAKTTDGWQQNCDHVMLQSCLKNGGDIQAHVERVIVRYRPELAGCFVSMLNFCYRRYRWEIYITHGSLALVPDGEESPEIPLVPEVENKSSSESWCERESML